MGCMIGTPNFQPSYHLLKKMSIMTFDLVFFIDEITMLKPSQLTSL